jgi:Ca-activated chloride channel homolog
MCDQAIHRTLPLTALAALFPLVLIAHAPHGDAPQESPVPLFTAASDLVVLHVNVVDRRSRVVAGLPETAFEVYEDGVLQAIQFFQPREAPIAAGLVIDNSSSMLTRQRMVRAGVAAFADLSRPNDEFFTIVFNEHVRHGLPAGLAFTRSRDVLLASLGRAAGGRTAMHDAVIEGLTHLETASNQKRVLLVLTDGDDNASMHTEPTMLQRAGQSSALIYTIWTGDLAADPGNPSLLRKLAQGNGGSAYRPSNEQEIVNAFSTVAETMRRGYTIGYAPTNTAADGTYRRITVRVRAEDSRVRVHVRDGYTARKEATRDE